MKLLTSTQAAPSRWMRGAVTVLNLVVTAGIVSVLTGAAAVSYVKYTAAANDSAAEQYAAQVWTHLRGDILLYQGLHTTVSEPLNGTIVTGTAIDIALADNAGGNTAMLHDIVRTSDLSYQDTRGDVCHNVVYTEQGGAIYYTVTRCDETPMVHLGQEDIDAVAAQNASDAQTAQNILDQATANQ